jgi:hypothetical protein
MVSASRNEGCGQRTQALLDSIPHYAVQANTYRSSGSPVPFCRAPAASTPPEAAGNPVDLLEIPPFLRRAKKA